MQPIVQRDPEFWRAIFADVDVTPTLFGESAEAVVSLVQNPAVIPLATEHGGLLFIGRCGFGRIYELHTAYTREGWGREVHAAAKAAFRHLFGLGAELVFTHEQMNNWRSRPPKSFGFKPLGEPFANELGEFRMWMLTREAWAASPASARRQEMN